MSIRANVDARRLNERVTFERNTPTQTATGDRVPSWATLVATRAAVDGMKASRAEPTINGAEYSVGDYTLWVRADIITRFGVTVADRIRWGSKIFDIKDIPDQQLRGRLMAVICHTGLNWG